MNPNKKNKEETLLLLFYFFNLKIDWLKFILQNQNYNDVNIWS